jgi:hypothetical protein
MKEVMHEDGRSRYGEQQVLMNGSSLHIMQRRHEKNVKGERTTGLNKT